MVLFNADGLVPDERGLGVVCANPSIRMEVFELPIHSIRPSSTII